MSSGIKPRNLSPAVNERIGGTLSTVNIGIPFVIEVPCVAATDTYKVYDADCPDKLRVIDAWGVMTGAGAGGDTVKITDGTNDITDTVDLSAVGDTDRFAIGEIDDAYHDILPGGSMSVVTASAATVTLYIMCTWVE